ncbi:hypothetical protein WKW50_05460 [Ochrobactrum sp. GPK 3]
MNKAPVGSKWKLNAGTADSVLVVTERKPGGIVEFKITSHIRGRVRFGRSSLSTFLSNATPLIDA